MSITVDEAAAIVSLIGAIVSAVIFLWRIFRMTRTFVKDQEEIKTSINKIKNEVTYNGGGSLKDMVRGLNETCDRLDVRQQIFDQRSKAVLHYQDRCLFETDKDGNLAWANEAFYQHTVRYGDISGGLDWITVVDDDERDAFLTELKSCLEMSRRIEIETVSVDNRKLHFLGYPYRVGDGCHEGFLIHILIREK